MIQTGEMVAPPKDLWSLVRRPYVDAGELAGAIREEAGQEQLDFRTRLLIRDGLDALRNFWGEERLTAWLAGCPGRDRIESIWREELGEPGFSTLAERIMDQTAPETVRQFLRELGGHIARPAKISVGGSIALILTGHLTRGTEDIDVVDELPEEVRTRHQLLKQLGQRYGLQVAHFQSHYLPEGWEQRQHSLGAFGELQVSLVDVYDVLVSKLFSAREKDRDDLRTVVPQLDKDALARRFRESAVALAGDAALRKHAEENWYILFGEPLPS